MLLVFSSGNCSTTDKRQRPTANVYPVCSHIRGKADFSDWGSASPPGGRLNKHTSELTVTNTHSHILPLLIMLFQTGEISWHLSCWVRLCVLMTRLAAIMGIHGVSSSEWFPISQSAPGNKELSPGVIAFSWNSKDPKMTWAGENVPWRDLILNHLVEIVQKQKKEKQFIVSKLLIHHTPANVIFVRTYLVFGPTTLLNDVS